MGYILIIHIIYLAIIWKNNIINNGIKILYLLWGEKNCQRRLLISIWIKLMIRIWNWRLRLLVCCMRCMILFIGICLKKLSGILWAFCKLGPIFIYEDIDQNIEYGLKIKYWRWDNLNNDFPMIFMLYLSFNKIILIYFILTQIVFHYFLEKL